jgi:hypothetical protein
LLTTNYIIGLLNIGIWSLSCVLLGFFWTYQPGPPTGSFYWARDKDYHIGSNFWKFYFIITGFTLGEPVSLVKVFRLFRLERNFLGVQTVDELSRCTTSYPLAGPTCLWCLVNFHAHPILVLGPRLIRYGYDTGTSREFLKLIYQSGITISWCNGINIDMTNMIPAGINFQLWYNSSVS